jgi:cytochrome c oxidase subunit 1
MFRMYADYKREHPGVHPPLQAYISIMSALLWVVETLGVAATILFQLLPLSLGWTDKVGIDLSRTLFWYFGHPHVYFWLLPAYIVWCTVIPKIVGGKVCSDALARMSFLLFLLFSFPVGFHHQLLEPGISALWKYVQVVLTFLVIIPSLMTAFSMFATFELAGRRKGATGVFCWVKQMPYRDVRFLAPFIGMLFFIPAGAGGVIKASHQLNIIVHNTLWVTGHFHITVGAAVALTFFGTADWLVPLFRGRTFTATMNRLGLIQTVAWTIAMLFM